MCTWTDRFTELESESDSEIEAESSNVKMSELKEKKNNTLFIFLLLIQAGQNSQSLMKLLCMQYGNVQDLWKYELLSAIHPEVLLLVSTLQQEAP